jgi:hypothetical protein
VLLEPHEAAAMEVHGGKDAAVLVPLFEDPGGALHAVFTRRRHDLRRHPGEISFPGGRRDEDEALLDTALRDEVMELSLDELRAGYGERRLVRRGIPFRTPTYEAGGGDVIWGATARILGELIGRLDATTR